MQIGELRDANSTLECQLAETSVREGLLVELMIDVSKQISLVKAMHDRFPGSQGHG